MAEEKNKVPGQEDYPSRVEEAPAAYLPQGGNPVFGAWTYLEENSASYPRDVAGLREIIAHGLDIGAFNKLKAAIGLSAEELTRIVRIPLRTLARRKRFKPDESERILRVATVLQRAVDVLGSVEAARRWLGVPRSALGGFTPLQFCDTEQGAREVEALLGRLEHGVFS